MTLRSGCRPMYQAGYIAIASVVLPKRGPMLIISRRYFAASTSSRPAPMTR